MLCCIQLSKKNDVDSEVGAEGVLYKVFQHAYAPFILSKPMRAIVMVVFFGWLCASIALAPHADVGLDQDLSMPEDSYMLDYFNVIRSCLSISKLNLMMYHSSMKYLARYLAVGAPVYFVVRESELDYTSQAVQKKLCGGLGCDVDSLVTQIYVATKSRDRSYIAATPASWIDDYLDWFRIPTCCRVDTFFEDAFCPAYDPSSTFNYLKLNLIVYFTC